MTTYFSGWLNYRNSESSHDSGMGLGGDDLHNVLEDLSYHIEYYKNLGYRITEIKLDKVCKICNGNGTIFIPNKRNKFLGKNKTCPECKGKNSSISILDTDNHDGLSTRRL
jgi:hypothetical protein